MYPILLIWNPLVSMSALCKLEGASEYNCISSYNFTPWIVSSLEYFPHLYVLWPLVLGSVIFGFPNSKNNSFRGNYMRKKDMYFSWLCNSNIYDNFALLFLELLQQWTLHFRFLQKVNVTIDDHTLCKEKYGNYNIMVNDKMICASDSGQDSCQGDSGGPLLKLGSDGKG